MMLAKNHKLVTRLFEGRGLAATQRVWLCVEGVWRAVLVGEELVYREGRIWMVVTDGELWPAYVEKAIRQVALLPELSFWAIAYMLTGSPASSFKLTPQVASTIESLLARNHTCLLQSADSVSVV
jgi:hypothetical protein